MRLTTVKEVCVFETELCNKINEFFPQNVSECKYCTSIISSDLLIFSKIYELSKENTSHNVETLGYLYSFNSDKGKGNLSKQCINVNANNICQHLDKCSFNTSNSRFKQN